MVLWKKAVAIHGQLHDPATGARLGPAPKALNGNCTPPVISANFIIPRGLQYTSGTAATDAFYFPGLRTQCQAAAMVANGMLYSGPTLCGCDSQGRIPGFPAFGTAGIQVADAEFAAPRPVINGTGATDHCL